jgi:hypothetical protein
MVASRKGSDSRSMTRSSLPERRWRRSPRGAAISAEDRDEDSDRQRDADEARQDEHPDIEKEAERQAAIDDEIEEEPYAADKLTAAKSMTPRGWRWT